MSLIRIGWLLGPLLAVVLLSLAACQSLAVGPSPSAEQSADVVQPGHNETIGPSRPADSLVVTPDPASWPHVPAEQDWSLSLRNFAGEGDFAGLLQLMKLDVEHGEMKLVTEVGAVTDLDGPWFRLPGLAADGEYALELRSIGDAQPIIGLVRIEVLR